MELDMKKSDEELQVETEKIFLFGYGSLLWKIDFKFKRKYFGYVNGFVRNFWLLSDVEKYLKSSLFFHKKILYFIDKNI